MRCITIVSESSRWDTLGSTGAGDTEERSANRGYTPSYQGEFMRNHSFCAEASRARWIRCEGSALLSPDLLFAYHGSRSGNDTLAEDGTQYANERRSILRVGSWTCRRCAQPTDRSWRAGSRARGRCCVGGEAGLARCRNWYQIWSHAAAEALIQE